MASADESLIGGHLRVHECPTNHPIWLSIVHSTNALTVTWRQFARGTGTTPKSGFSSMLFRQCPAPHNKTPHCAFERLLLPTNGATAAFEAR